jgi:hypothetical protein
MNRIMNRIKIGILGVCAVCLGVSAGSLYLISPPTIVSASSCTATCPDGRTLTCTGDSCGAQDGVGCSETNGGITNYKKC